MTIGQRFKVVDVVASISLCAIVGIFVARSLEARLRDPLGAVSLMPTSIAIPVAMLACIFLGGLFSTIARGVVWSIYRRSSGRERQLERDLTQLAERSDGEALGPLLDAVWPTLGVPEGARNAALHAIRAHLERVAAGEPYDISTSQVAYLDSILGQQLEEISAHDLDTQRARRAAEPSEELQLALAILRAYPHVGGAAQLRRVERLARSRRSASGPGMKQVRAAAAAAVEPLRERLRTRNTRERLLRPAAPDTGEGLLRPAVAAQDGADRQLLRAAVADEVDSGEG